MNNSQVRQLNLLNKLILLKQKVLTIAGNLYFFITIRNNTYSCEIHTVTRSN